MTDRDRDGIAAQRRKEEERDRVHYVMCVVCASLVFVQRERERERERSVLWVRFRGKTYFVYLPKHGVFQWLRNEKEGHEVAVNQTRSSSVFI